MAYDLKASDIMYYVADVLYIVSHRFPINHGHTNDGMTYTDVMRLQTITISSNT